MEDETKVDVEETETETEETTPEIADEETEETEEETEETSKDIDYEKELERVQGDKPQRTEKDKAERALHFNAQRARELGVDVETVLGIKPKKEEVEADDVDSKLDKRFAERDARARTESDAEFKLVMWYMENKNLSVDEAYFLANKGKITRAVSEGKRAQVTFPQVGAGRKVIKTTIPQRSPEEQQVLTRRGLQWNPKSQTWRGKFTEEFYDPQEKMWKSRKISR